MKRAGVGGNRGQPSCTRQSECPKDAAPGCLGQSDVSAGEAHLQPAGQSKYSCHT